MGQKVHPLGFRIGVTQTHRSQWFAKPNEYAKLVKEDLIIREYDRLDVKYSKDRKSVV